ncbi:unknown [Dialister sp. CAG:357]|nr:unknown [Dialister sp. CAG:357]
MGGERQVKKTVKPRVARGDDVCSPYGASSDTLKPRLRLGENQNHSIGLRPRNCTPFCHSVTSFLAEAGLKRNKEKVSNLICF